MVDACELVILKGGFAIHGHTMVIDYSRIDNVKGKIKVMNECQPKSKTKYSSAHAKEVTMVKSN